MDSSDLLRVVVFRLGDVLCALPAGIVREILPVPTVTRLPGAPVRVEGLANVRGSLLTVLDAHRPLGRSRPDSTDDAALLVVEAGDGRRCGVLVGEVLDFVEVPAGGAVPGGTVPGAEPGLVRARVTGPERDFVILDAAELLVPLRGRDATSREGS